MGGLQDLGISVDGAVMVEVGGFEFLRILKIYIYTKNLITYEKCNFIKNLSKLF